MSDDKAADAAADAVQRLTEDLDLPHRLRDVGVEKSDFRALAEDVAGPDRRNKSATSNLS